MEPARRYEHDSPVREYGGALALVVITQPGAPVGRVIDSLAAATRRPVRVVVVEVGPGVPGPPGAPGDAQVVRIPEDVGRAAAVNRAVAGLDGEVGWVAVAEPGVAWSPGTLDALIDAGGTSPRAGVLGPRLRDASGVVLPSAGPLPSLGQLLRRRIPVRRLTGGRVGWLAGVCMLVRRAAWDSVDGFDPRYDGAGEIADVDLGDRLARAGWLAVHVPTAEATLARDPGQGMLGAHPLRGGDLRRFVRDRYPAPVRALAALASTND
ncbi:MAG: glycosyltransferase [Pseudonocardia sp.]|nr:glycosyltransferase [Pseudonocardia sp.]